MANKKSVPHKAGKPAPKKPAAKPAPKKVANKPHAKPVAKKAAPKKKEIPVPKNSAAKPAPKKVEPVKKPVAKPVAPVAKGAPKPEVKHVPPAPAAPVPVAAAKPLVKKNGVVDPKSLVSIKPTAKPVIKKEPPKPTKVVIPKTTIKSAVKYEPEFTKSVLDTPMYEYNGPSMRYSDADLVEFREIISKKLDAAKKELAYLQGLITRRDEGGDVDEARYMTMEDGSVSMEREQLSQMASRQITFIDHLEKAMMRIENKTYGICRVTGKLIDKARLRAVPHATLSIEAKQLMNK
ncbi:MAG: TraR/DksA C4-type zinc finger protein [Bacteroidota bacterium]